MQRKWFLLSTFLTLTLLVSATPAWAIDPAAACGAETARQEKAMNIPDRLLHAISLVESGRWDSESRASFAWPWTVMAEGEGRFLPTKAAAIAEVRKLQAAGVRNIDVGCMQVNLQAHPQAFANLDEAFEPSTNVGYAARFLVGLHESTQNWQTAGAYYHSQTPSLAAPYKARLVSIWDAAKQRPDERMQLASLDQARLGRPSVGMSPMIADAPARPLPSFVGTGGGAMRIAERKQVAEVRSAAERVESKRIADAYRQARLEEYRLRKAQSAHG
ncbi:murein transglycosylase [Telmatospirillum sp.]|uniref:murein transglycosylase n=1 Tax=Telmatospirillum sp. TaxID=2079197 RepID=UPI00284577C4|nr:murein transglycosylase [Telmatospirillum sp.]MDR3440045.1 murein transglycosylase [Telmatospirillum sp.]